MVGTTCRYGYFDGFGGLPIAGRIRHARGTSRGVLCQEYKITVALRVVLRSAIETLSSKQRAHLRSLAHELKPVLHIGKDGLTAATVAAAKEALNTRELMKIRVLENAPNETRDAAQQLANEMEGSSVVQIIGRTAVLYRPDPDRPRIVLPQ